ncbi:MAG: hypothetical protein IPP91_18230 [Betaproteobacteria bacterium]|nr:hypothetical protein [Betaproteobacteria bacterium]
MLTEARFAILAAAALLAGCTAVGINRLEPGKSTEADARRALGEPARSYSDPDGSRQLVFPQGPEGGQTYMVFLAPDGSLRRVEQALTNDSLRRIQSGSTTKEQLGRLIGPPWRIVAFPNLRQDAWDYVIQDDWGYTVDFSVMIDERGIVAGTVYARRERGDGGFR